MYCIALPLSTVVALEDGMPQLGLDPQPGIGAHSLASLLQEIKDNPYQMNQWKEYKNRL